MTRPPIAIRAVWAVALAALLAGCVSSDPSLGAGDAMEVPDFASAQIEPPPGVNPDSCWVRDIAPAQLETVTRQVEISPGRFRTETVQVIEQERQELIFETPCPNAMTQDFIATLQRALDARGLYRGPISGVMDVRTLRAVRRYQSSQGLPSGLLSMQAARGLGLLKTPRDQL